MDGRARQRLAGLLIFVPLSEIVKGILHRIEVVKRYYLIVPFLVRFIGHTSIIRRSLLTHKCR